MVATPIFLYNDRGSFEMTIPTYPTLSMSPFPKLCLTFEKGAFKYYIYIYITELSLWIYLDHFMDQ